VRGKKRKNFDVNKEIRAIARERVGSPKPARAIEPKPVSRKPKYKKGAMPVDADSERE
jgi:hypothetical protein